MENINSKTDTTFCKNDTGDFTNRETDNREINNRNFAIQELCKSCKLDTGHYFDFAATSPFDKEILYSSLAESIDSWANPSSIYKIGTSAKEKLNSARNKIAQILNVEDKNIFFTSGGTESNHIPLLSILNRPEKGSIIISAIEHPAVNEQCNILSRLGYKIIKIKPDNNGIINVDNLISNITDDTLLISVMLVNNETGAIQPVKEIAQKVSELTKGKRQIKIHADCVQALGKIEVDLKDLNVDSAAFSAHKIGGPRGIGVLYLKNVNNIEPFLKGGGQEQNIRSGTENVFGAIAFSKCIEKYTIRKTNVDALERFNLQKEYTNEFIEKLATIIKCHIIPETRLDKNFNDENFSPWIIQVAFDNIPGQVMVRALDSKNFYISTGSACSSKKNSRPILEAMNVNKTMRENAVRISFGPSTTKKAMDELFDEISNICKMF